MKVALDVTPLAGQPTGIGAFTAAVADHLSVDSRVALRRYGVTARGGSQLPGAKILPVPASLALRLWQKLDFPKLDWVLSSDVIHGTNFVVPPHGKNTAAVVTVHDLTSVRFPEMCTPTTLMYPSLIQRAIDRGAFVHTPTEAIRAEVIEHFSVAPSRVRAIHHGLTPAVDVRDNKSEVTKAHLIVAVGTIEPRKDYPTLLKAFDVVAESEPLLRLAIIGARGWGAESFDAALAAMKHGDRVDVMGYVDNEARRLMVAQAKVFVYPSIYEGFGLPPLDAMAEGTAVVASDIPAVREVVGDAALLTPVGDFKVLAESIKSALNADLNRDLVDRGRVQITKFSWEDCSNELVKLYKVAIGDL